MTVARRERKLLRLDELVKRMEASPVTYSVHSLGELPEDPGPLAALLWPQARPPLEHPTVRAGPNGASCVAPLPTNAEADAWVAKGEVPFGKKDFAAAEALYRKALEVEPAYYPALIYAGDAALWSKRPADALALYDRAVAADPFAHQAHYFRATALRHLGRLEEARQAIAWALVNRPRYPAIARGAEQCPECVGAARYEGDRIEPRAFARRTAEGVSIFFDPAEQAWLGFGMCKGLWLGDEEHSGRTPGSGEEARWSSEEELECLGALLTGYEGLREADPKKTDPELERIVEVVEAGYATELVLYELGARVDPHLTLTIGEQERNRLHEYVLRFVLPKE